MDTSEQVRPSHAAAEGCLVVGIGASAGGVEALQGFFEALPEGGEGLCFVVILHLDPQRESSLAEVLQRQTSLRVEQVTERRPLAPGHVYVIPPDQSLSVEDGHLVTSPFTLPRGRRAPIDLFFRSLAALEDRAVAILLSGGGTDGTVGLKAVKESGGLVMVQDPQTAAHGSMPRSALATGLVDVVLAASELGPKLVAYGDARDRIHVPADVEALPEGDAEALRRILAQLQGRTGHDFSSYKQSTVLRRIGRRMQVHHLESLADYLRFLRSDADEPQALLKNLLISVTRFFRDPEAWESLADRVVPSLFDDVAPDETLRVWVPGCATGEEAYTLAMLFLEHAATVDRAPSLQIFASDLDEQALAYGRRGLYPAAIEADVSSERLERFFVPRGDHYQVRERVRERVLFAPHSLLQDPPFSKLHLVSCRNLLIYLDRSLQDQVLRLFHYALLPGRYLFLGSAESADGSDRRLYEPLDTRHRIYRRRDIPSSAGPVSLQLWGPPTDIAPPREPSGDRMGTSEVLEHRRLLEDKAPPSVVVDRDHALLHLSGTVGRYLLRSGGKPSDDLLREVRPELLPELQSALQQAFEHGRRVSTPAIEVAFDGRPGFVHLIVQPDAADEPERALVLFAEVDQAGPVAVGGDGEGSDARARRLEDEARRLRDRLQMTVEEYESSREEMKASNEELQSINEEYKSTAEELETSKEELQSVNEELETVNAELEGKVEELSQANSDLQNLLASTDVATLFLDRELRIQRYTPQIARLFHVRDSDVGRPITHLTHEIRYDSLEEDARRVLQDLAMVERKLQTHDGRWFLMRLRPYRTVDDRIEGLSLTMVDVTELEQAVRELEQINRTLEERVRYRTAQVRKLASTLTMAEQQERRRVAQILHDDLQQRLYSLQMKVVQARTTPGPDGQAGSDALAEVEAGFDEAIAVTRRLAVDLSPPVLDREGLPEALSWLQVQMEQLHGLEVELELEGEIALPDADMQALLFQIVREVLFNVVKHADTDRATVRLEAAADELVLRIRDQGRGFDVDALQEGARRSEGIGLYWIGERLDLFGAEMRIDSRPGHGTEIVVCVPLSDAKAP